MGEFIALLLFGALAAACWYCSVAAYRLTFKDHDPIDNPHYATVALGAIVAVALTGFIPFPGGFFAGGMVWAVAAYGCLGLPPARATALTGYLVAASFVERLLVLGVMDMFGI